MGNVTVKTSGDIASFMTPAETNIKSLKVHFSPKQLGEGDPSPDNVREIVGWDGVEVNGCGRNLLQNADGSLSYLYLKKGTTITISQSMDSNVGYFRGYDINKTTNTPLVWINQKNNGKRRWSEYTLEDDIYYAVCYTGTGMKEAQITLDGSVDYEPYQGNNISYQWKKLPDEYQEVEYIESTGTQYIELPFGFDRTDEIEARFTVFKGDAQYVSDKYIVSPSRWNDNNNRFAMGLHSAGGNNGNQYCVGFGNSLTSTTFLSPRTSSDFLMHTWEYKDGVFSISEIGLRRNVVNDAFGGTTYPLKLFYGYNSNTRGKIAYYKHKKANGDTYDLVPCYRKSDGEIGMYDTVSQTFYTNQGTGTFLKGEDVNKTFYGGYVDLVSGELVEEWGMFTVDEPDTTWKVNHPARIIINFPRKYIFSSRTMPRKSMCTIIPERSSADFNYGYLDNVSSIEHDHVLFLNYTGNGEGWAELFGEEATNENVKPHLQELGFAICATLVEPITHQLTPTQLSSFVGQNNFWSNADYVEVEYDLIETEDIQKCRKKIILNQPHIESVKDNSISFNTDLRAPLKECKVYFEPVQEGSGDPSPDNVRNITGWNKVEVKNGDNVYSIDWTNDVGTVYGGYVDLVKGELVATHYSFTLDGVNYYVSSGGQTYTGTDGTLLAAAYDYIGNNSFKDLPMGVINSISNSISNKYLVTGNNKIIGIQTTNAGSPYYRLVVDASELDDISNSTAIINSLKIWLQNNPIQICYKLAEPIHYQLTPQQILSLKGINNFSCGIKNDLSVRYWNYKKSNSNNIAYEAKNLTFDGTNYINTGVYLFTDENINRDFELVAEGINGSDTVASSGTIICAKYNGKSYGFLVRLNGGSYTNYNGTISLKMNYDNSLIVRRVNGVISISGDQITNPKVKFTNTVFEHPLVLGCAVDDDGTYYRYGHGTIQHIVVRWL